MKQDELSNNKGSDHCKECQCPCCTLNIPPFLTKQDIQKISNIYNMKIGNFVDIKTRRDGISVFYARQNKNGHCMFYNEKTKKCNIYENRPTDCRLFPLDIIKENNHYYWIKYDICKLSNNISKEMIEYLNRNILPTLRNYIDIYSTEFTFLWEEGKGKIIAQIPTF